MLSPHHALWFDSGALSLSGPVISAKAGAHGPARLETRGTMGPGFRRDDEPGKPCGVLVPVEHLVNGASITRCEAVERIDYFHIELDSHDVILADGAAAETFVDCDSRQMFHNAAEFAELYPGENPPRWALCAPRLEEAEGIAALRQRLAKRAGIASAPGFEAATHARIAEAAAALQRRAQSPEALDGAIGLLLREAAKLIARKATLPAADPAPRRLSV
jgi:Hint domain